MSRSIRSLDMARIAADLLRLEGYRSVYGLVSKYFRDERLRTAFSFHPLLIGGNPFRASAIYCLITFLKKRCGVHFAMGGMGALVARPRRSDRGQGGEMRCDAEVERDPRRGRSAQGRAPRLGRDDRADIVVSNADSAWTYRNLVPAARAPRWTDRKLDRARYSMGLFVWYFGVDRRYHDVAHHTILLGPRYRELLERHFRPQDSRRRFQPLSPPADRDRSVARAAGLRCVLRALAGAESRGRAGLDASRPSPTASGSSARSRRRLLPGLSSAIVTSRSRRRSIFRIGSTPRRRRLRRSSRS